MVIIVDRILNNILRLSSVLSVLVVTSNSFNYTVFLYSNVPGPHS
jgi:hypothetical protein